MIDPFHESDFFLAEKIDPFHESDFFSEEKIDPFHESDFFSEEKIEMFLFVPLNPRNQENTEHDNNGKPTYQHP